MWPFGIRSPLSAEDEEWQFETWRWLLERLGGTDDLKLSKLILPTPEFFPRKPWLVPHLMSGVSRASNYLTRHDGRIAELKAITGDHGRG